MAKTHPTYPLAFRAEAVELARTSGKGIPQFADELAISGQALRRWLKHDDVDAGRGPDRPPGCSPPAPPPAYQITTTITTCGDAISPH